MISRERLRRWWPHARAALILAHMAAILTICTPARYKVMAPKNWEGAEADARFRAWAERLTSVGIDFTTDEFRRFWRARAENYLSAREFIAWPAQRYVDLFYIGQGWSLFSTPKRKPAILVIDIHDAGGWRPLYKQRSDEHTWRRRMFDNNRMRKLVGRFSRQGNGVGLYYPVGNWIARLAASDFPEADMIRTQLWRYQTSPPGEPPDPDHGRLTDRRVLRLEAFR